MKLPAATDGHAPEAASGAGASDAEAHLREKAKLLLQRERELFEMRTKHERMATWLSLVQSLPELLVHRGAALTEIWDGLRLMLLTRLRLQRVLVMEMCGGALRQLAPAGPERALAANASALLDAQPFGLCNEPSEPAMLALCEALGLQRFMWSKIVPAGAAPLLLAAGFDQLKARFQSPFLESDAAHFTNAAHHIRSLLTNALLVDQLRVANEDLEQRVRERTQELAARNREMHLVLDNVDQALMMIDLDGRLAPERSTMVDRWFGSYTGHPAFIEHVAAEPAFADSFINGMESIREDFLPLDLCLKQMPKRLLAGERQYEFRYLPLSTGEQLEGLLIVADDITEHLARAREELGQRELLAAFTALMRDRLAFSRFFDDTEITLTALGRDGLEPTSTKRLLHTLKGNAALFGLNVLSSSCHAAESELVLNACLPAAALERIRGHWRTITERLSVVSPVGSESKLDVTEADLACLAECARAGASGEEIVAQLRRSSWEPLERSLSRLGQHASALARRLGKGELQVCVEASDLRLEPRRWAPLWAALVHVVRNAVDHGLEAPQQRSEAGKPQRGVLRLAGRQVGTSLQLEIADDGRGIDWDAVRRVCQERGLPSATRRDLLDALCAPDFSTRKEATEVSGRGIGLATLAAAVAELGGRLEVVSELLEGTCWALSVPLDASASSALAPASKSRAPTSA